MMMQAKFNGQIISWYDDERWEMKTAGKLWQSDARFKPYLLLKDQTKLEFTSFAKRDMTPYQNATHEGFYITYSQAEKTSIKLRTYYLLDKQTAELLLRLMVIDEDPQIQEIAWPAPLATEDGYSVLPYRQGILLSHDESLPLSLPFNGQFCSAAAYLSMLGSVEKDGALLIINETPWDSRYEVKQLFAEKRTRLCLFHLPSLGLMRYRRDLRYAFFGQGDYNTLAKYYRQYLKEHGRFKTLAQKKLELPQIDELIKCSFVHMGIQTYVQPTSRFYDPQAPEKNNHLTSFAQREKEMVHYYQMGMEHLYLHLDGWGVAYDNQHPDVMPINQKAGGALAMRHLVERLHDLGYLFGIHDQYRDYYHLAPSYKLDCALEDRPGEHLEHANWAGGVQNYLCASLAKDYVKRNFTQLAKQGIQLDAAYLDVFTCNELDECFNIDHRMTRQDCARYREQCFQYLVALGIMPSSEELNEWAMNSIVFCHYAPYEFQMYENGQAPGIGIPLFNLVYHECAIIPWMMDRPQDDYMLYALLNGGAPYFRRDAAYPNIDGAFVNGIVPLQEQAARCRVVTAFHEAVAGVEMVEHRFLDSSHRQQMTRFANGYVVWIDLDAGTYEIQK